MPTNKQGCEKQLKCEKVLARMKLCIITQWNEKIGLGYEQYHQNLHRPTRINTKDEGQIWRKKSTTSNTQEDRHRKLAVYGE